VKCISRWEAPLAHPLEESENHYVDVHVPKVRGVFAASPNHVAYTTVKVLRQYDDNGGWGHRLESWRYIITESTRKPLPPPSTGARREADNCIRNLRSCEVREEVLLDRNSGQSNRVHYLFEYDRAPEMPAADAESRGKAIVAGLGDLIDGPTGIRRVVANWVLNEAEMADGRETANFPTGVDLPETTKVLYLEFVFDSTHWGDRFFAQAAVRDLLLDYEFDVARGFHVLEQCEYDAR
jgi:hypothetical protein